MLEGGKLAGAAVQAPGARDAQREVFGTRRPLLGTSVPWRGEKQ